MLPSGSAAAEDDGAGDGGGPSHSSRETEHPWPVTAVTVRGVRP